VSPQVAHASATPASAAFSLTTEQLEPYVGEYFDSQQAMQMQLEVKVGVLQRASDGLVLTPTAPAEFRTTISRIRFTGTNELVRVFDDGRRWEFNRIKPWKPTGNELAEFAGQYHSDEAQATYDITVMDGQVSIATDDRRWDSAKLELVSKDMFTKPHHAYRFVRNSDGRVSSLQISNGWEHVYALSFQRIADAPELQRRP
jgi:hypothetical protein